MTRQNAGRAANVVIPVSAVVALCTAFASMSGVIPQFGHAKSQDEYERRLTSLEARQIEYERQWREDRNEMLRVIYDVQGAVRRIEGKLEK